MRDSDVEIRMLNKLLSPESWVKKENKSSYLPKSDWCEYYSVSTLIASMIDSRKLVFVKPITIKEYKSNDGLFKNINLLEFVSEN